MKAFVSFQRHWSGASDTQFVNALNSARDSVSAFAEVTSASGSLLQSWIGGREVVEFDHYPPDDVVDLRHGSQFYYHAHRDGDREHGHLHLFCHATASGRRRYFRPGQSRWTRTAPTHLFAISLDARGLPVGLLTVNRWVTDGHWLDAPTMMSFVNRFVAEAVDGHEQSCRWLTGFVRMYLPLIEDLLVRRDRRLARRSDLEKALNDHQIEVLSLTPIDWAADLDTLEAEAFVRGL
ncbi:DUF6969 family protein [Polaromonas sp. AET17H-212]|uniref:DUF6969 family protein n=1 Tax=Polaromonas sp. AET17H-212 TaxID=1977061 RepID=UPI001141F1BD|nr:hypothetical protein [Polaromonas sp. AET17H-212]